MAAGNLKLSVILTAITGAFNDNIRSAGQRFRDALGGMSSDARDAGSSIEGSLSLRGLAGRIAAIYSMKEAIQALASNAIVVQQLNKQLEFATGGGAQAAAAFALVRDVSNTLGVNLEASAKGFAQLAAATKGTQLEGQATRDLFIGISQAAAVLNLSTEETGGVINALSQIASKGTVQLEELKGQLGDRLPGVLKIAADSMGVTVAELNKMVESGLDATVFLSKFGPALQQAFSEKAKENIATLGGQINVLKNQFFDLLDVINKAGGNAVFTTLISDINGLVASVTQAFKEASASPEFAGFGSQLTTAYETLKVIVEQIKLSIEDLYGIFETVFSSAQGLFSIITTGSAESVDAISPISAALLGLNVVVGAIADGFKTIRILIAETMGALSQISATVTGTLGNLVGAINKTAGDALKEIARQRQEQSRAAFADGERLAQEFKSSTVAALEATGNAAKAAAEKTRLSTQASLAAADAALTALVAKAKEGGPITQKQADDVSKVYQKLGQQGVLTSDQLKGKLEEVAATVSRVTIAVQTFFTEFAKGGAVGAQNLNGISLESAKTVIALGELAARAGTTSRTLQTAFTDAISGAKTARELKVIEDALLDVSKRGKLTRDDIAETLAEIGDKARSVGTSIPESFKTALDKVSGNFKNATAVAVDSLIELGTRADTTATTLRTAFDNSIKGAKTAADLKVIGDALSNVGVRGKLTQDDIAAVMLQISAAAEKTGTGLPKTFEESLVRVGNSFSGMGRAAKEALDGIAKSTQDSLDRVGVVSQTALRAAVAQATEDLARIRALVGSETTAADVAKAQDKLDEANKRLTPGIITMGDVTKRLADINRDAAASAAASAEAASASGKVYGRAADELADHNAKVSKSARDASEGAAAVASAMATQFANLRDSSLALSAAAADDFGRRIGVQFGFVEDGARGAADAIGGLIEQNNKLTLSQLEIGGDPIFNKMQQLEQAANATHIAFLEAKQSSDAWATSIGDLASSGTAKLADLERVAKMGISSTTLLGEQDLAPFRSALDAAKNRIEAIKNASLSAAQALHAMGDSFQIEILRASGDEVAVIKAEAAAQQAQIDAQIAALGANASAQARAEALRASQLLAQITGQKIAAQQASDARDKADALAEAADAKAAAQLKASQAATPPSAAPPTRSTTATGTGSTSVIRFEDASGKAVSLTGTSDSDVATLLTMLQRAGATNITKQGA